MASKRKAPSFSHCGYMSRAIEPKHVKRVLSRLVKLIRDWQKVNGPIDAIAFRGLSGSLMAPLLSYRTGIPMIAVRKPNDGSHSYKPVEGAYVIDGRYIIVDDFIDSGATVKVIVDAINGFEPSMKFIGTIEYQKVPYCRDLRDDDYKCLLNEYWVDSSKCRGKRPCDFRLWGSDFGTILGSTWT